MYVGLFINRFTLSFITAVLFLYPTENNVIRVLCSELRFVLITYGIIVDGFVHSTLWCINSRPDTNLTTIVHTRENMLCSAVARC